MIWGERCLGDRRFRWAGSWKIEGADCAEGGAFLTTEGTEQVLGMVGLTRSREAAKPRRETQGSEEGTLRVVVPLTSAPHPFQGRGVPVAICRATGNTKQRVVWSS